MGRWLRVFSFAVSIALSSFASAAEGEANPYKDLLNCHGQEFQSLDLGAVFGAQRDQGKFGTCFAHAAVQAVEAGQFRLTGVHAELSADFLASKTYNEDELQRMKMQKLLEDNVDRKPEGIANLDAMEGGVLEEAIDGILAEVDFPYDSEWAHQQFMETHDAASEDLRKLLDTGHPELVSLLKELKAADVKVQATEIGALLDEERAGESDRKVKEYYKELQKKPSVARRMKLEELSLEAFVAALELRQKWHPKMGVSPLARAKLDRLNVQARHKALVGLIEKEIQTRVDPVKEKVCSTFGSCSQRIKQNAQGNGKFSRLENLDRMPLISRDPSDLALPCNLASNQTDVTTILRSMCLGIPPAVSIQKGAPVTNEESGKKSGGALDFNHAMVLQGVDVSPQTGKPAWKFRNSYGSGSFMYLDLDQSCRIRSANSVASRRPLEGEALSEKDLLVAPLLAAEAEREIYFSRQKKGWAKLVGRPKTFDQMIKEGSMTPPSLTPPPSGAPHAP